MRTTKAGQASSKNPASLDGIDHKTWRECFAAAIAGAVAAHRRAPNPKIVARLAARIADHALEECRKRRAA